MNIAIFAAHPDDELLGIGGTIAAHAKKGDNVFVSIMGKGVTARGDADSSELQSKLMNCAKSAAKILGVKSLKVHDLPDNRVDQLDLLDLIKIVEKDLSEYSAETVYTHFGGDLNIDHARLSQAVVTATRPTPGQTVKNTFFFETLSATEWQMNGIPNLFQPNYFVDISKTLSQKLEALKCYATEMRDWPHARSIKAVESLARLRGATIGKDAAESFMVGRMIG